MVWAITWAGVMGRPPLPEPAMLAGDVPSSSSAVPALLAAGPVLVPKHRLQPPPLWALSALLLCVWAGTRPDFSSPLWVDTVVLIYCVCTGIKVGRSALLHYKSAADLLMKQNTCSESLEYQEYLSLCSIFIKFLNIHALSKNRPFSK